MSEIIDRVAAEAENDPALIKVDNAIDQIVSAIDIIEEQLPKVKPATKEESDAITNVQGVITTGLAPYVASIIETMEVFHGQS